MSAVTKADEPKMTFAAFLRWSESQVGRYELVRGYAIEMQSERARHAAVKGNVYFALRKAIDDAKLPCTAFTDGLTVEIDDEHGFIPDALVQCGEPVDPYRVTADKPLIVVEVQLPSTVLSDVMDKLPGYMTVPSIEHVLIIDPFRLRVLHFERRPDGAYMTRLLSRQDIVTFKHPGFTVPVGEFFQGLHPIPVSEGGTLGSNTSGDFS
jgi:Uma2 family endonuclease